MINIYLERLLLFGALSSIVIAALWSHVKDIFLSPLYNSRILFESLGLFPVDNEDGRNPTLDIGRRSNHDHPRLSGRSRSRSTNFKESFMSSTYRSLGGYGQSSLSNDPSYLLKQATIHEGASPSGTNFGQQYAHLAAINQRSQPSSLALTLFSALVIALISYTILKMLTSKINGGLGANHQELNEKSRSSQSSRATISNRRRLYRLNRDERAKQLILQHGGKNISHAIKFLIQELEKQKQLLLSNTESVDGSKGSLSPTCTCSCHSGSNV